MQNQYPTFNSSILEAFLANLAILPVDNLKHQFIYNTIANRNRADPYKFEGVELAKLNQLYK